MEVFHQLSQHYTEDQLFRAVISEETVVVALPLLVVLDDGHEQVRVDVRLVQQVAALQACYLLALHVLVNRCQQRRRQILSVIQSAAVFYELWQRNVLVDRFRVQVSVQHDYCVQKRVKPVRFLHLLAVIQIWRRYFSLMGGYIRVGVIILGITFWILVLI